MKAPRNLITDATKLQGIAMPGLLDHARKALVGRIITHVGYLDNCGDVWPAIVLDNGTVLTVSRDDEGNGPGSLFIDEDATDGKGGMLCRTHRA